MTTPVRPTPPRPPPPASANPLYVIGAALVLALYVALAVLREVGDGHDAAFLTGVALGALALALIVVLIVFAIARRGGRTVTSAARSRMVFWTALGLLGFIFLGIIGEVGSAAQRRVSLVMSDSERAGLVTDADSIRHALFGFVLPHPGSEFARDSAAQHRIDSLLAKEPGMAAWVLTAPERGESVIIQILKTRTVSETVFQGFIKGVRQTATRSPDATVTQDTLVWTGGGGEFLLEVREPAGFTLSMRCLPHAAPTGAVIACVSTTGADPEKLAFVRAGLTFPTP